MKFTRNQKSILVGTILGDAFLQRTGKKNARLRLEHGERQKEYLLWKGRLLNRLFTSKPVFLERAHPKTNKIYKYWRLQSNSMPELGKLRDIFYPHGKKIIPASLKELLKEPLSMAVWFMDDGYFNKKEKNSFLYLGRVSREEAKTVQGALFINFGLLTKIYDKKNKGMVIFFPVKETLKLGKIISPYIIKELSYKNPS